MGRSSSRSFYRPSIFHHSDQVGICSKMCDTSTNQTLAEVTANTFWKDSANMRDDFSQSTKEVLFKRARGKCSNPTCRRETSLSHSEPNKAVNLGEAAHITAASPGGPRYDPALSVEERNFLAMASGYVRHVPNSSTQIRRNIRLSCYRNGKTSLKRAMKAKQPRWRFSVN
jgi:hypothetical protein